MNRLRAAVGPPCLLQWLQDKEPCREHRLRVRLGDVRTRLHDGTPDNERCVLPGLGGDEPPLQFVCELLVFGQLHDRRDGQTPGASVFYLDLEVELDWGPCELQLACGASRIVGHHARGQPASERSVDLRWIWWSRPKRDP